MHSLRNALARSARLSSRAAAVKPLMTSRPVLALRYKASEINTCATILSRQFSQSARRLDTSEEAAGKPAAEESNATESIETPHAIFVRNVTFDTTDQHLAEHFEKYGPINGTFIGRDGRGLSKGWGFVYFTTQEAADMAVKEANGTFWNGRRVMVQLRESRSSPGSPPMKEPTNSLFVGNIPYETTDSELNQLFRELENLDDVRVAVDRTTGWPRGFAHADFLDVASAQRAAEKLATYTIGGRTLRVDFAMPAQRSSNKGRRDSPSDPPSSS